MLQWNQITLIALATAFSLLTQEGQARSRGSSLTISGPVSATLVKVLDGDTIVVTAEPWPQQRVDVSVRLRGIDAPEMHSKCLNVRHAAEKALSALSQMTSTSNTVLLAEISGDKYFGRVIADVYLEDGRNAARVLLNSGLVVAYDGGRKSKMCEKE